MARANIFDDDDDKVVPINPGTDLNIDDRFKILCDGERRNVTFEMAIDALWRERFGSNPE